MNKRLLIGVVAIAAVIVVLIIVGVEYQGTGQSGISGTSGTPTTSTPSSSSANATSSVPQTYHSKALGITFSYPSGWSLGSDYPVSIDNFNHAYAADGSVPQGGASIDLASTTLYGSLNTVVATELLSATGVTSSSISVGGSLCSKYSYQSMYNPNVASKNLAVYCLRTGNALYKFYLSYRAADQNGAAYAGVFDRLLNGLTFVSK